MLLTSGGCQSVRELWNATGKTTDGARPLRPRDTGQDLDGAGGQTPAAAHFAEPAPYREQLRRPTPMDGFTCENALIVTLLRTVDALRDLRHPTCRCQAFRRPSPAGGSCPKA